MPDAVLLLLAQKGAPPVLMWPLMLLIFAGGWVVTLFVLASLTGWRELAQVYGSDVRPQGETWTWQSANLRMFGGYNNCLTFVATSEGLWMRPMWPFNVGHRGLFFPWADVRVERGKTWGMPFVKYHFRAVPSISIRIPQKLADKIENAVADRLADADAVAPADDTPLES